MTGFRQITKMWGTRRIAALALVLAGVGGLTILAAIAWRALDQAPSREAAISLAGQLGAGGLTYLFVLTVIGVVLDRALAARAYNHRDLPARPEFYDYGTPELPQHMEELSGRALKSLTFTVFDTETTGLRPSQGDEIIAIAGVRVSGGTLRRDTTFEALVNPGFPVPKPSIRFHGITDRHCHVNRGCPQGTALIPFQVAALAFSHTLNAPVRNLLNVGLLSK